MDTSPRRVRRTMAVVTIATALVALLSGCQPVRGTNLVPFSTGTAAKTSTSSGQAPTSAPSTSPSVVSSKRTVSPWAVATSATGAFYPDQWARAIRGIGVTTVRGFADREDTYAVTSKAGLSQTGILQWSPSGSALTFPVDDLAGWRAYVAAQVRKFPHTTRWEVWNEPPNFSVDNSAAHYATILAAASQTAKAINPKIRIGIAVKATYLRWLAAAIKDGAKGHYDYITVHPYERTGMLLGGNDEVYASIVPQIRAMLAEVDPARINVPVSFTETGVQIATAGHATSTSMTQQDAADLLVKSYALGLAQGAQQIAWFEPWDGDNNGSGSVVFGLLSRHGTRRPAFTAYASLIAALGKLPNSYGWARGGDGSVLTSFQGTDGGTTVVAWADPRTSPTLRFGSTATITDPSTGATTHGTSVTLTRHPVIVHVPGSGGNALARRTATHTTAVVAATAERVAGTTATRAATVSGDGASNGLTWINAPASTTVAGVRAIPAGSSSVIRLFVSPTFASWHTTHLRLTIRAYGLADGAGFNLRYDASRGVNQLNYAAQTSASGGWRSIAKGRWTTVTYDLPDASLSGTYGYTMILDSDSTGYSQFAVSSMKLSVVH